METVKSSDYPILIWNYAIMSGNTAPIWTTMSSTFLALQPVVVAKSGLLAKTTLYFSYN